MTLELKIPLVGESISEVEVGDWLKAEGDFVNKDENVVALESEKATVELPAPSAGTLVKILKRKGEKALVGEVIGAIDPAGKPGVEKVVEVPHVEAPKEEAVPPKIEEKRAEPRKEELAPPRIEEKRERVLAKSRIAPPVQRVPAEEARSTPRVEPAPAAPQPSGREEEVVHMTPLRRAVAERLVEARQTMAMLTTFNEIDMSSVRTLRKDFQESFSQRHGIKLGFMSFFVKAAIDALKQVPQLNASVRDQDIVYHNYFDIGIAVSGSKGLAVPVLRNADRLGFAETEKAISDFSERAQTNKLKPEELQEGTFTITNGGVFGSLLSTPIINPPQSGILGMHAIQDRPVAVQGNVEIRPMMYVALSYDHRIVDGREAVLFLRRIKEVIESPARLLLET